MTTKSKYQQKKAKVYYVVSVKGSVTSFDIAEETGLERSYALQFLHKLKAEGKVKSMNLPDRKGKLYYFAQIEEEEALKLYKNPIRTTTEGFNMTKLLINFHLITLGKKGMDYQRSVY